jgi:nucleoredoxin
VPRLLALILVCSIALVARAARPPLTVTDISLMLRTGYSSKTVMEELATRRFADTLDSTKETKLVHAGATAELLAALKGGTFTVSAEEAALAKEQKAAEANRRVAEAEKSRKFNTLYQSQLARDRAAQAVKQQVDNQLIYQLIKGDLVRWNNGAVSRFDDAHLEKKKLFLLYFSAHWCQPCRVFTPGLVNYYNEVAPKHPELELIFVSRDKSPFGMETYMHDTNMPWPAIDFQKVPGKDGINRYAGDGIPDLVLVDSSGKVISDSYQGKKYIGPAKVLSDLEQILSSPASGYAANH